MQGWICRERAAEGNLPNRMEDEEFSAIVVDNGSGSIKAGFAGDDCPKVIFPTMVGNCDEDSQNDMRDLYVGNAAQEKREMLTIKHPIEEGIIEDWDGIEKIWEDTFGKQLCIAPEMYDSLLTEAPLNPQHCREKMAEIMFEKFNFRSLYLSVQPVLALYQSGRTSGLVVDCGHTVCHTVPIYEGYNLPHAIQKMSIGGRDIDEQMYNKLHERYQFIERQHVSNIKEKLGYVALDYEEEMKHPSHAEETFELPDGSVVLENERFCCPEILFQPSLIGKDIPGIHSMAWTSTMKCDIDMRVKDLSCNTVLTGGSTLFSGFAERLEKEIASIAGPLTKIKITAPVEGKYGAWIGGSILSSLSTFQCMWVSKKEYNESGPSIVQKKCY